MKHKDKPGIAGLKLDDYDSFRYYTKRNKKYWQDRWKQRKGKQTARGWNNSEEYKKFVKSQERRESKLIEENPGDYVDNAEKKILEGKPKGGQFRIQREFEGIEAWSVISKMKLDKERFESLSRVMGKPLKMIMTYNNRPVIGWDQMLSELEDDLEAWRQMAAEAEKGTYDIISFAGKMLALETGESLIGYYDLEVKFIPA